jgi:hypothetical protein
LLARSGILASLKQQVIYSLSILPSAR